MLWMSSGSCRWLHLVLGFPLLTVARDPCVSLEHGCTCFLYSFQKCLHLSSQKLIGREPVGNEPVSHEPVGNEPVSHDPEGSEPVGHEPEGDDQDKSQRPRTSRRRTSRPRSKRQRTSRLRTNRQRTSRLRTNKQRIKFEVRHSAVVKVGLCSRFHLAL